MAVDNKHNNENRPGLIARSGAAMKIRCFGVLTAAFKAGQTCIDCHNGIAHTLPAIEQHIGAPKAEPADPSGPGVVNPREAAAKEAAAASR